MGIKQCDAYLNQIDYYYALQSDKSSAMTVFQCSSLPYSLALRNVFYLSTAQSIMVYILGPLSLLFAVANIAFFIKTKSAKQPPTDILLFISIFSIIKICSYLSTVIYNSYHPVGANMPVPDDFFGFCAATGFMDISSQLAKFIYNLIFCLYYISKIRNPLKAWVKQNKQVHVLCFILIGLSSGVVFFTNSIGISIIGVCSFIKEKDSTYISVSISLGYLLILAASSFVFLKYLKKVTQSDTKIKHFFRYYFKYLIIVSINYAIQGASYIGISIICDDQTNQYIFDTFTAIVNATIIITPIFISIVLLNHPDMKRTLYLGVVEWYKNRKRQKHNPRQSFFQDLLTTNRNSILIELNEMRNLSEDGYLTKLKEKNRACLLGTTLGCITIDQIQSESHLGAHNLQLRTSMVEEDSEELFSWNYSQKIEFTLTDGIAKFYPSIFPPDIPAVSIKFISYCGSVFKQLMQMNHIYSISQQLNPVNNLKQIIKNVQSDGGRSGQFFYFNYNNTLILKSMSTTEKEVLLNRLQSYHKYFLSNPQSFIVKIYGVFTVKNVQTGEEINFMLMGNILRSIPKKYVSRVYDLKGSSHHRQVISNEQSKEDVINYKTLKDIDFQKYEEKIWIDEEEAGWIKMQLERDSAFLCSQGLIDYSLILMKVDYNAIVLDYEDQSLFKHIRFFHSTRRDGMVYILGIIDYLQTWNIKKKGQKWYKSIWTKSQSISSQNPTFYMHRFMTNLINVIFS